MKVPFIVIGGGLSGLAAAIRFARYSPNVLLLEKHNRIGGLNSYYYRNKVLLETGLHAVTNYADPQDKHAPLNRLLRQLKLRRKTFTLYPQYCSEIQFAGHESLRFSNDADLLRQEICDTFPSAAQGFDHLVQAIAAIDPFQPSPYRSAKQFLNEYLDDELLTEMLLCPLMFYGSSVENDMDLGQFVIMFRSIYEEGMFRPEGTMKTFLDTLMAHYTALGGNIRMACGVKRILHHNNRVEAVELNTGELIECDHLLSTIGHAETLELLGDTPAPEETRLGFVESIFLIEKDSASNFPENTTILFYNQGKKFKYRRPDESVDFGSGVICLPGNFRNRPAQEHIEVRSTHLANYHSWATKAHDAELYQQTKAKTALASLAVVEKFIGSFHQHIVYQDTFTPLTIQRYTSKKDGAIYGSVSKIKDGDIGYANLFLAGTDQGFLGIIGSMLSGVSMVNQHILPKTDIL